jgi:tetratricopeptide (TPR) repeat protein
MHSIELDEATYGRITAISEEGNSLVDAGDLDGAINAYKRALELVPKPIHEWEAATWLFTALGDILFLQARYKEARDILQEAMRCPKAIGNPFIHLRLGQVYYELKDDIRAKDELARAYMGGDDEIFEGEDPKYKHYIMEALRPKKRS